MPPLIYGEVLQNGQAITLESDDAQILHAYQGGDPSTITPTGRALTVDELAARNRQQIEAERAMAVEAERERLAAMELAAKFAHETYYGPGGEGYGTTPGGPDVTYWGEDTPFIAPVVYGALDPLYGEGGALEPVTAWVDPERSVIDEFGGGKENLLLYGALAIGALALLRR